MGAQAPRAIKCDPVLVMPGARQGMTISRRLRLLSIPASYPPRDSTILRQGSDRFALFAFRQAFICGGLPTCSAQNFPASERQAICSWGVGADCAWASEAAARATT